MHIFIFTIRQRTSRGVDEHEKSIETRFSIFIFFQQLQVPFPPSLRIHIAVITILDTKSWINFFLYSFLTALTMGINFE